MFYVLTAAGPAGPYLTRGAAEEAARPLGFPVIDRRPPPCPRCGLPMEDDTPCKYDPADPIGPNQCPDPDWIWPGDDEG